MSQASFIQTLLLLIPAAFANMAPVIFRRIQIFAKPVSQRLYGENKTWRGIVFAIIFGSIIAGLQALVYPQSFENILIHPLCIGAVLGFSAIIGDLLKSFFKRRLSIPPGQPLLFFDQSDWIIMSLIFIHYFFLPLDMGVVIEMLIIFVIAHFIVNYIAYKLNIREKAL